MLVAATLTAVSTPRTRRASAAADGGRPGPSLLMARSAVTRSRPCSAVACSMVVLTNRSEPAIATVSTSGVLAEEKRRAEERTFVTARKPPTREIRATSAPGISAAARATSGPRNAAASTSTNEMHAAVTAAVSSDSADIETSSRAVAPAIASRPPSARTGPISRRSTAASCSARVGLTRAARRAATQTASHAVSTPLPTATMAGIGPACIAMSSGAMPRSANALPSARPSAAPGTTPASDATRATSSASQPIMRRTWRGVAATARRSAISRSRSWTVSPSVLATTNIAMSRARPPNEPAIAITAPRDSATSRYSAAPRSDPVRTRARGPATARSRLASAA